MRILYCWILLLTSVTAVHAQVYDAELTNYSYPYSVQFLPLEIQGQQLKMAYMDVKPSVKANGKTVVLLHGKNFNGAYWDSTTMALTAAGFRVIVPDQIGFGKSSKPAHLQYSFQLLARNTKLLLDTLGVKKAAVLGHSMGGMLAVRFALMYLETTEKLVLENPIGLEDWKTVVPYQTVDQWYTSEQSQSYEKIRKYQMENYYFGEWTPAYEKWARLLAGWTTHKDYPRVAWNAALTYDMIFTQPVIYEFPDIKVPTLLIIGQKDRTALGKDKAPEPAKSQLGNYPELGRNAAKKIPGAKLVELEGVGHLPHIQVFGKFIGPLVDFLK